MAFGIQPNGFVAKPYEDIRADLVAAFKAVYGEGIDTEPTSKFGQLIGIMSDRLAELWQQGEALYNAAYPDGAAGINLDNVAGITGTIRAAATHTLVSLLASGTPGTVLPAGRIVSASSSGIRFETLALATIGGGGTVTVAARAVDTGPLPAPAAAINTIETPVAGWASVTNPADHTLLGTNTDTDAELRARREEELRGIGTASVDAIRAAVFQIPTVTEVFVFENDSDATVDTIPPHSFEVIVAGGNNTVIAQTIFDNKSAGIYTHGTTGPIAITDSQGTSHDIRFTRPDLVPVYVGVTLIKNPAKYPLDGDDQVKAAIVAFAEAFYKISTDVYDSALVPAIMSVPGILDADIVLGTTPSPIANNVAINGRQIADFDTSRITVA